MKTNPNDGLMNNALLAIGSSFDGSVQNIQSIRSADNGWRASFIGRKGRKSQSYVATYDGKGIDIKPFTVEDPELDQMVEEAKKRKDADADDEKIVMLAAKAIYEQSNWQVLGIRNLVVTPGESLSVQVVIENEDTNDRVIVEAEYDADANEWTDRLLAESKADEALDLDTWRMDKKGKGSRGKRTTAPKCNKGRPCGMSCIAGNRNCRVNPTGAAEEALKTVVSGGSGAVGGNSVPPTVKGIADNLAASSTAIVRYEGGASASTPTDKNAKKKYFTDGPDPGLKRVPTQELLADLLKVFDADSVTALQNSKRYQMATAGMDIDLSNDSDIRVVYREWVRVPMDERNPPPGPAMMNGINVMRTFRPWAAFNLKSKTATRADLKRAYREAIMGRHPDQGGDREIFEQLRKMYQSLDYHFALDESLNPPKSRRSKKK